MGPPLRRTIDFWVHDPDAPSFRHRLEALYPALEERGFLCHTEIFPRRRYVVRVIERLARIRELDLLVIAKLKLLPLEARIVRRAARRIVYDFDDAIYLGKPNRPGERPDLSRFRHAKFAATCRAADLVIAGNPTLAREAERWSTRVAFLPTAVDVTRYATDGNRTGKRLVWIGQGGNLSYLSLIRPVLDEISRERPDLTLRIVCDQFPHWPELKVETEIWSSRTEAQALSTADVGLMPLCDDGWTRGKGAFKLLQYGASALPSVASPVGMNRSVLLDGATGYLAASQEDWSNSLRELLRSPEKRYAMGRQARQRVEDEFDLRVIAPKAVELYEAAAREPGPWSASHPAPSQEPMGG